MEVTAHSGRRALHSFTLVELLVVMAVIIILLVAIVPALNSISKSSGRKSALNNLLGAIEQTRTLAIKDGQASYLVFADQVPGNPDPSTVERYAYRSYAVFEDDPANPGSLKQITAWKTLPAGVSFRSASLNYLANTVAFPFSPMGSTASGRFRFLKFNSNGEVDPVSTPSATTGTVQFGVFEGYVDAAGSDKDTNKTKATESVAVNRLTGRAERM